MKFASDITSQQESLAETKGVLSGINATMATIEFTPRGHVIHANENFLRVMNYTIEDVRDRHHRMFVPEDMARTSEYETFWQRLASGQSTIGVFRRVTGEQRTVWLNAIYNPIRNARGEVVKVVKFATDVSSSYGAVDGRR